MQKRTAWVCILTALLPLVGGCSDQPGPPAGAPPAQETPGNRASAASQPPASYAEQREAQKESGN